MTYFTLFATIVVLFAESTFQLDKSVLDMFPDYNELHETVDRILPGLSALQTTVPKLASDVKMLQSSLNQLIGRANRYWVKVGFSATRRTKHQWFNKGSTVPFEKVWVNYGSGYNSNTGVFVAKVSGLYSFSATIMARYDGETVSCGLAVNGAVRSKIYGSTKYAQGVISDVVSLNVGDRVQIKMVENGGVYGNDWSLFSGHLIQQ